MTKSTAKLILLLFLLCSISCMSSKKENSTLVNSRIPQIDSLLQKRYESEEFGGGIVISKKNEVIYENYFGIADRTWNIKMNKDVKFDIASVNKSFIAALIMKSVESGLISLEDRLIDRLEGFSFEGTFNKDITIHNMLTHTSGLPDYGEIDEDLKKESFLKFKRMRFSNKEYVDFISKLEPRFAPNEGFYYSNFAYHLLAILLEDVHGKPFEEILSSNLSKPLGLKNTMAVQRNEDLIPLLARGYNYDSEKEQWLETPFIDLSLGRRIFSTPHDLNRWAQVMDNPGYLSEKSLDLIQENHLKGISSEISYGYGWFVVNSNDKSKIGRLDIDLPYIIHGGSTDAYKSMLININSSQYVISFLSNLGSRTQEMDLAQKIVNILIN